MNPLAKSTLETSDTLVNFPPPTYLKHLPIFMLPYEPFDGAYCEDTDTKYLSVGLAQYRESDSDPWITAKVWRNNGEKWNRSSEEIPAHRLADMCILLTKTFFQKHVTSATMPTVPIPAETFENQTQQLELRRMAEIPEAFYEDEDDRLKQRLRQLRDELLKADLD